MKNIVQTISKSKFKEMWYKGSSLKEISDELGIHKAYAGQLRKRLKLPRRNIKYVIED